MNNSELWQAVLAELEINISRANFVTWFKNTGIISNQQGLVIICVPNAFTKAWMEKKYHQLIIKSLERITGKPWHQLPGVKAVCREHGREKDSAKFVLCDYLLDLTEKIGDYVRKR